MGVGWDNGTGINQRHYRLLRRNTNVGSGLIQSPESEVLLSVTEEQKRDAKLGQKLANPNSNQNSSAPVPRFKES